jgi:RHS repeat-associated protein
MRTTFNGAAEGSFTSLPFGDAFGTVSGTDGDPYHFAMLDHDYTSDTDHAQFRQYSSTPGRWMSPDPYYGSYNQSNPQTMNRYSYALNNPMSFVDPSGYDVTVCDNDGNCSNYSNSDYNALVQSGFFNGVTVDGDGNLYCNGTACGSLTVTYSTSVTANGCSITDGCTQYSGLTSTSSSNNSVLGSSNNPIDKTNAMLSKCAQQGSAAANSVPSPAPNAQDQIEAYGGAAIGLGVAIATAPGDGPAAPLVYSAIRNTVIGFFHTAIVRTAQKLFTAFAATQGCIVSAGGSTPIISPVP